MGGKLEKGMKCVMLYNTKEILQMHLCTALATCTR